LHKGLNQGKGKRNKKKNESRNNTLYENIKSTQSLLPCTFLLLPHLPLSPQQYKFNYNLNIFFMNRQSNLKTLVILTLIVLLGSNSIMSQGVAIGENPFQPHNSSILELQSNNKGLLIPRLTTQERNNINLPALSLMIFNTTTNCLEIYVAGWHQIWCNPQDTGFLCGLSTVTFTYKGQDVTYGTVESSGKCWLDRNLGASQVATSSTDHLAYGDLFQWGRAADGHQIRTSGVTAGTCDALATNTPPHSDFIKCNSVPHDWRNPQNVNLWQGVSGTNNPCPPGWRVPTQAELQTELNTWNPKNSSSAFNSPLKLPAAGYRDYSNGSLGNLGLSVGYWSSTVDGIISSHLGFNSGDAGIHSHYRALGFSVRCIKD